MITSPQLRGLRRMIHALRRQLRGGRPVVHYFHQVDDPYAILAVQALPHLSARFDIELQPHLVSPPSAAAAPDPARLKRWSRRDAETLARRHGLPLPLWETPPNGEQLDAANAALADVAEPEAFAARAHEVALALARGTPMPASQGPAAPALAAGDALRERLGHYLGAMFHFEGEWYWGLDRLHYLEARLAPRQRAGAAPAREFAPRPEVALGAPAPDTAAPRPRLDAYISFRSPYSAIAMPRLLALADHYQADLQLRFVLPMVMRGMAVPWAKRLYIVLDAKRESERLGLSFGSIADPVGRPAERGLAVLHHALATGRGAAFAASFLRGVFGEGIDAGTERGLFALSERAGLSRAEVREALADESWRAVAEANRSTLFDLGLWGVPSFQVADNPAVWGQDRLWLVQEQLDGIRTLRNGAQEK